MRKEKIEMYAESVGKMASRHLDTAIYELKRGFFTDAIMSFGAAWMCYQILFVRFGDKAHFWMPDGYMERSKWFQTMVDEIMERNRMQTSVDEVVNDKPLEVE